MIGRLWSRLGWQASLALLLSMLSIFSIVESPAFEWLGWFGFVGSLVAALLMRVGGIRLAIPSMIIGFVANVAALLTLFVLVGGVLRALSRRKAAEHHGAA